MKFCTVYARDVVFYCAISSASAAVMLPSVVRRRRLLPYFRPCFLGCLFSSSSIANTAAAGRSTAELLALSEYLVKSCGLSDAEALRASKSLVHFGATKKADVVLDFLKLHGFDGSHIKKLVQIYPRCLRCNVEDNLAPKFQSFREMGFSETDLVDIILFHDSVLPKLKVWEGLVGSRERLVKHIKKTWFFGYSIEKTVQPNLNFFRDECGIPEERISRVARQNPKFPVRSLDSLRALVVRAENLGVPRQSAMFMWALYALSNVSKERVEARVKLMMSFGWSESEFSNAVRKMPTFLSISQEALRRKMEFLTEEVGYKPSCIADQPLILGYNLEKKLIPRFRDMELLKSKGLWTAKCKLISLAALPDKKVMEKFVMPYKEKVPELLEIFGLAAEKGLILAWESSPNKLRGATL
ncbi:mTERF family protein [Musa troglodytarum]|uniref:mTERF family protein n=1 Tax=Musa troglodytarum TaxID=320322 RepID=A0A9E7I2W1_9LILI|nr:mTERF family protein [Musa troglodytarum]